MRDDLSIKSGSPTINRIMAREIAENGFRDEAVDLVTSDEWKTLSKQEKIAELRKMHRGYRAEVRG